MNTVVVLGSVNADHVLRVSQLPKPGETVSAESYRILAGGKGANQAVAACRSGANTRFTACVGDDDLGARLVGQFQDIGIDTRGLMRIPNQQTGTALIFVDPKGENCIGISAQANGELTAGRLQTQLEAIEAADILLVQLETPLDGIELAAAVAQESATQVVLNPAPARALPDKLLRHIDLITPNQTEAERLTGISVSDDASAAKAAAVLHAKGIPLVLITLGARGVWLSEQGKGKLMTGFKVDAVDTTAAGDCFNGALVAALLEAISLPDAIRFAQAAAAISVTQEGALDSIPSLVEVQDFLVANSS